MGKVQNAGIFYPDESWLDITSATGKHLHTYRFHNPTPKAILVIFHSMYCASNEATHVAKRFYEEGYAVIAMDMEGHGKSGGARGNIISLDNYSQDIEKFLLAARTHYPPDTPIFAMGLSMGGTLCVMAALLRPDLIKGMVLFAPGLSVSPDFEPFLQKIVRCLNFCCCACLKLTDFDPNLLTRNKDYVSFIMDNPDNYNGKMNVRSAYAMLEGFEHIHARLRNVSTPVIAFQGGADKIVSAEETKNFISNCAASDKEFVFYDDMYHETYHEPEIQEILEKAVQWVNERADNNRFGL